MIDLNLVERLYTIKEAKKLLGVTLPRKKAMFQVRAYNVKYNCDVGGFLEAYRQLLERVIDEIWRNMGWVEKGGRLMPIIPKGNSFKRNLRNLLMGGWIYSRHYVDSVIKQAYSILKSWRRNYLKGRQAGIKPVIGKRFVRGKAMFYSYRKGRIKVSEAV